MKGAEKRYRTAALTIDVGESAERVIRENPVVIFSKTPSCCMCHVMRTLLATLGVNPPVVELEEPEMEEIAAQHGGGGGPAVFIGGRHVGGLESLMGLHLSGDLLPKLRQVGALSS